AEDGIGDRNVTGVQTCALPIWLVLAYVYYKTGTIRAPIIIHATNNILATIPIIDQGLTPLGITINIVLIVIGLYSLITLRKISRSEERRVGKESKSQLSPTQIS